MTIGDQRGERPSQPAGLAHDLVKAVLDLFTQAVNHGAFHPGREGQNGDRTGRSFIPAASLIAIADGARQASVPVTPLGVQPRDGT